MNSLTHFLAAFDILYAIFYNIVGVNEIIIFAFLFGVLVDIDVFYGLYKKKAKSHLRTWIQEPLGLVIIGLPIGILLSLIVEPIYILLVILPYASHIALDYITFHIVSYISPLSKESMAVGFIKPFPPSPDSKTIFKRRAGISELYIILATLVITVILVI